MADPLNDPLKKPPNKAVNDTIAAIDGEAPATSVGADAYSPVYQVFPNSKIPVSKHTGAFWKQRLDQGLAHLKNKGIQDRWEEAVKYYQNDQGGKTNKRGRLAQVGTGTSTEEKYTTENIVFANVSALIPSVYAKNPDVEITAKSETSEAKATMYENLADQIIDRKFAPGISLKNKMRRATVLSMLTNISYLELSYVKKEDSSEEAMGEIELLSQALIDAKSTTELAEIEGKLMAMEEKVNLLAPSGPKLRVRNPASIIVDPASEEADLSDAAYIMVQDYVRTSYLRAMYGTKDENGDWKALYEPTHVLEGTKSGGDIQGHDDEMNNFTLLGDDPDYKKYGYKSKEDYEAAAQTMVWYVWDKTTRRVLMYHNDCWEYPIWVWDDPYHLTRFFPLYPLTFYTDPYDRYGKSEVMYYLDQQDEINVTNNERARMRHWILSKVFVNTAIVKDVNKIKHFLSSSSNDSVWGINLPDGVKISDAIGTMPAPSAQFESLFDNRQQLESINRMSSVTPVLQSVQFKTNTTNQAINSYTSSTQTRLDEKIDAIEDAIGDIAVGIIEMCIQFMDEPTVSKLIGQSVIQKAGGWDFGMTPQQWHEQFVFEVAGGSTLKPTSKVKKDQAIQLGQVLGQFAGGTPAVVVVLLKIFERAFSEDFVMEPEDWDFILNSVQQQLSQASAPATGANGGGGIPPSGAGASQPAGDPVGAALAQVETMIDKLPPAMKKQMGAAIAQGVPLKQIIQAVLGQGQQQQPAPQAAQPQ